MDFQETLMKKGTIYPTKWYDEQQPFEFEFVVADVQGVQKIFDNLKIISNKVEPNSNIWSYGRWIWLEWTKTRYYKFKWYRSRYRKWVIKRIRISIH